jgi:MFS transporter, DHA1 family, multidrug resistance protein
MWVAGPECEALKAEQQPSLRSERNASVLPAFQTDSNPRAPMPSRLFALCLAGIVLIGPLAVHLFLPVIPAVKAEFALSEATAQLTFSSGIFAMAFSTLAYGTLSDRFGRRPVLLAGLALFLLGCTLVAVAQSFSMLLAGRIIQAVGAGCGTALVRSIARDAYGQAQLVKAISYLTMFYTLGPMISPMMGGLMIDAYGWRAAFVFAFALGCIISLAAAYVIYETHQGTRVPLDALAVLRSYIDPFRNPRFAAFVLQTGFSSGVFFTLTAAASIIMKEQLGRSATEYGTWFFAFPAGFLLGNIVSSRLAGRAMIETMVLAGSILMILAAAFQSGLLLAGFISPLTLFGPGLLLTFAQGIAMPSAQSGAMAMMPSSAGTAAGIGVFTQMFVGAAVSQAYGLVAGPSIVPLVIVMLLSAGMVLVCGIIPYRLANKRPF